jgi:hypothetical protein
MLYPLVFIHPLAHGFKLTNCFKIKKRAQENKRIFSAIKKIRPEHDHDLFIRQQVRAVNRTNQI